MTSSINGLVEKCAGDSHADGRGIPFGKTQQRGWQDPHIFQQDLNRLLLAWYGDHARILPWRLIQPDPYKTWISEIMLQQTQVATVLPYFERFLKIFPTVEKLAEAPVEKVVTLWSGLGYYSRARNLHAAARQIAEKGTFPSTMKEWIELPGVGEYTAGAIASIAFDEKVPVVDGNVIRVLTRIEALSGDPKKNPLKKKLWKLAAGMLPPKRVGDFNQALMELGATVCTPSTPKCGVCPVRKNCRAFASNKIADFPTPQPQAKTIRVSLEVALIEKKGKYLIAKRNGDRHFQEMWEFPQGSPAQVGLCADKKGIWPKITHSIMNRRIQLKPILYHYIGGRPKVSKEYVAFQWIFKEELKNFPTSSLNNKIVRQLRHVPRTFKNLV